MQWVLVVQSSLRVIFVFRDQDGQRIKQCLWDRWADECQVTMSDRDTVKRMGAVGRG